MEVFDCKGHVTQQALCALIDDTLPELERLEVSEHLSFCDACLLAYTDLLTDDVLIAPAVSPMPSVLQRIRNRAVRIFFNRYVTMGVAASLAIIMWSTGFVPSMMPSHEYVPPAMPQQEEYERRQYVVSDDTFLREVSRKLDGALARVTGTPSHNIQVEELLK